MSFQHRWIYHFFAATFAQFHLFCPLITPIVVVFALLSDWRLPIGEPTIQWVIVLFSSSYLLCCALLGFVNWVESGITWHHCYSIPVEIAYFGCHRRQTQDNDDRLGVCQQAHNEVWLYGHTTHWKWCTDNSISATWDSCFKFHDAIALAFIFPFLSLSRFDFCIFVGFFFVCFSFFVGNCSSKPTSFINCWLKLVEWNDHLHLNRLYYTK